ncbi:unnamed protein product [Paramecium sonneborni]|uniref:EGF-like domain-containing protein n=1 Tax=Paramecium sonneborni TaxID=65129 RepID=A0A8S1MDG9_9CILI|nr:unnamed protein product [Paramecium sonneborni]
MIKLSALFFLLYLQLVTSLPKSRRLNQNTKRILDETPIDISGSWEPLRIKFEFVTDADNETKDFLDKIFSISGTFLSKYLLIRRSSEKIQLPKDAPTQFSEFFELSQKQLSEEHEADLVFYVTTMNDINDETLAFCAPIVFDDKTKRPIFGVIGWNMAYTDVGTLTNAGYEAQIATAVHEIIHGLGFVEDLFDKYYDSVTGEIYENGGKTVDNGVVNIITPRVVAFARKHFGCESITGLPMEQEGGDGTAESHWERTLFYNEMMTGSDMISDFVLTDFTFQLLQDTGYYRITEYIPDILTWGEGKGCTFYDQMCESEFPEFCSDEGIQGCAITHNGIGKCISEDLSNTCKYYQIDQNLDCRNANSIGYADNEVTFQDFGYKSMCVVGGFATLNGTPKDFSCYEYSCDGSFTIKVNGQSIDCSSGGVKTLQGMNGSITCPENFMQFCKNADECLNQCNKRGFCMKGLCTCYGEYYGSSCELENCSKFKKGTECVDSCPSGYFLNKNINYCIGCPGNCAACSSYNLCTQCNDGYELRGGFCDSLANFSHSNIFKFILFLIMVLVY